MGFENLLGFLEPGYLVPSHTHIAKVCRDMYTAQKGKVRQEIQRCGYVAFTTDIWTSAAVDGYMTVTAHFRDSNWQLCTKGTDNS